MSDSIVVLGAGPAGLSAAIAARNAGKQVTVYERAATVGSRFHGDLQALENWTTDEDSLAEVRDLGLGTDFDHVPIHDQTCFGPNGEVDTFHSREPFYYLLRRGPMPGTLDSALLAKAREVGVEIVLGSTYEGSSVDVRATGPEAKAYALARGVLFETSLPDGVYGVLNDELAPGGYGYLLVVNGFATLAVCIFSDFRRSGHFLRRTVAFFEERLSFEVRGAKRFGGHGNVAIPRSYSALVGEAAGYQDALWGFGIRYALLSGHLAGRTTTEAGKKFIRRTWKRRLRDPIRASFTNRMMFAGAGAAGYRWLLGRLRRSADPRGVLSGLYRPSWWKIALGGLAASATAPTRSTGSRVRFSPEKS